MSFWLTSMLTLAVIVRPGGLLNGALDMNPSDVLLLDFCSHHRLSIMNTLFRHKDVHTCTWHHHTLGRSSMLNFVFVLADLQLHVLDTWEKKRVELSADW